MGIFSKRMNREGAITGMIVGITFTTAYIIYFQFINKADSNPDHWWFGISPKGIGAVGMLLNFVVSFVVSAVTPKPPQDVVDMIENIRQPEDEDEELEVSDH